MKKRNESNSNSSSRKATRGKLAKRRSSERGKSRRLSLEGLESRQLMAVLTGQPTAPVPASFEEFTVPRNFGVVPAFTVTEAETTDGVNSNNTRNTAQFLPLGTGVGQQDTIDLSGTLPFNISSTNTSGFSLDIDVYSFDLQTGDILNIATSGAAGEFVLQGPFDESGIPLPGQPAVSVNFASEVVVGGLASPLQTAGNVTGTFVVPESGRYFLSIAAFSQLTTYGAGLRVYRPITESLAFGDAQILYLDFEGGIVDNSIFQPSNDGVPPFGFTIIPSIEESLPELGLEFGDVDTANALAASVLDNVIDIFEELTVDSSNGDFSTTGAAGDYAIRILSSRNPEDRLWFESNSADPRLSRLIIGGNDGDIEVDGVLGIAEFVDIGNFDLSQIALFALNGFPDVVNGFDISPGASQLDAISQLLGSVAAHEAAHLFGLIHTNNTNTILSIGDEGGGTLNAAALGLGTDGIFGTLDDVQPIFANDFFQDPTVLAGFNRVRDTLTNALSSGTVGGVGTSGTVFSDLNRNGIRNTGELGLGGVTVFADLNSDGIFNVDDIETVTLDDGSFSFTLPSGTFNVIALTPAGTIPTTALSASSAGGAISFGFSPADDGTGVPGATSLGTVFTDINGNGEVDFGEGVSGVFVYVDVDRDGRPDLFEPNTLTAADGTYNLAFPSQGSFSIGVVAPAPFSVTTPASGVQEVSFSTLGISGNADFIIDSFLDFGDAPASYGVLFADNGASHTVTPGLTLGTLIDADGDGQPSFDASGDDAGGIDDEDGVAFLSPLGLGSTGLVSVTVTNATGSPAFLQGFLDFNGDGDFTDPGEQFTTDQVISSGAFPQTINVGVAVPAFATTGNTFARFRLSQTQGIGATGFSASGEVEDYAVTIQDLADVLNPDPTVGDPVSEAMFTVSRNTLSNTLDVLANDFEIPSNLLQIDSLDRTGTQGTVLIASDGRSVSYTPPNGFSGPDQFQYSAVDSFGNPVLD